jgi:hypothetical protein
MVYFQTKNLGKFFEGLDKKMIGIFHDHLEYITGNLGTLNGHLVAIWYILPRFGILC